MARWTAYFDCDIKSLDAQSINLTNTHYAALGCCTCQFWFQFVILNENNETLSKSRISFESLLLCFVLFSFVSLCFATFDPKQYSFQVTRYVFQTHCECVFWESSQSSRAIRRERYPPATYTIGDGTKRIKNSFFSGCAVSVNVPFRLVFFSVILFLLEFQMNAATLNKLLWWDKSHWYEIERLQLWIGVVIHLLTLLRNHPP